MVSFYTPIILHDLKPRFPLYLLSLVIALNNYAFKGLKTYNVKSNEHETSNESAQSVTKSLSNLI